MNISEKGLETLLSTIIHRATHFQRSEFRQKLIDNDKSYYMGDAQRKDVSKENEEEEYSRYVSQQELTHYEYERVASCLKILLPLL